MIRLLLRRLSGNMDTTEDTLIYGSHLKKPKISYSVFLVLNVSHAPLSRSVINFAVLSAQGHVIDYHLDNRIGKKQLCHGNIMLTANSSSVIFTLCKILPFKDML